MEKIMNFINPKPAAPAPEILQLDDIIIENSLNPREGALDQEVIWDYAAHVDDLPAMHVFQMAQDNRFYLVSGFHRIAAHRAAGRTAAAFVVHVGTMDEAREFADLDNLRHGLRLTRAERRLVIERQLKRHSDWSDVRIATACYTTDKTVRAVRESLELRSEIPRMDKLVGADGIERPREVPRVVAPPPDPEQQAELEALYEADGVNDPDNFEVNRKVQLAAEELGIELPHDHDETEAEETSESVEPEAELESPAAQEPSEAGEVVSPVEPPAVEPTVPAAPPPPPAPARAALPPPVISEAPWSIQITIRPNGSKPLISIWHGQEQRSGLPADLAGRVIALVEEVTEVPPVEVEAEGEEVPEAEPEWLAGPGLQTVNNGG